MLYCMTASLRSLTIGIGRGVLQRVEGGEKQQTGNKPRGERGREGEGCICVLTFNHLNPVMLLFNV